MKNDARTNAILTVIVLLLALLAWYKPGLQQHSLQYLSTIHPDEIETIIIEREGMDTIRLSKQNKHWTLQSPYVLPANPLRVETVLALAGKRSYGHFAITEKELKRYGLAPPLVRVWLNDKQFDLGSKAPLNDQRYAINEQENLQNKGQDKNAQIKVHLINGAIYYQLRAPVDSFISPSLLPPEAKIIQIKWAGHVLNLKNGQWQLTTRQENAHVQADSVAQLVQYWQTTLASKVETHIKPLPQAVNAAQQAQKSIEIIISQAGQTQAITYTITQEDHQIKLLRKDLHVAWWVSPQQLKLLTEFLPVVKNSNTTQ